jgi:hypothetical protein
VQQTVNDLIPRLNAAWEAWIGTKKRSWAPTRSSSYNIGHGCDRYLTLERLKHDQKPPADNELQAIFEEGHDQEQNVIAALMELRRFANFEIVSQQSSVSSHKDNISARIDVSIRFLDDPKKKVYPVEIKSMHPHYFDKFNTLEDFAKSDHGYHRMYVTQVMSYLYHGGFDEGLILLKNKTSKQFKWIPVSLNYEIMNEAWKKAARVDRYVNAEKLPEPIKYDPLWCDRCDWRKAGECPVTSRIKEAKIIFSDTIEKSLIELHEVSASSSRADKLDKQVKEWIKNLDVLDDQKETKVFCGGFEIEVRDSGKINKDGSKSLRISINKREVKDDNIREAAPEL